MYDTTLESFEFSVIVLNSAKETVAGSAFLMRAYILSNSSFPNHLNCYSLDHQYQYSLCLQCHYRMKPIPFEIMRQILVIVLCYQDHLMIWLWIYLSFWNNIIPCTFLLCCCLQVEWYKDKENVQGIILFQTDPSLT